MTSCIGLSHNFKFLLAATNITLPKICAGLAELGSYAIRVKRPWGLRGLTLTSKFLLVFFLAKFLEPRDVGLYGLLAAVVGYGIYFVGFDFYTYASRELISANPVDRSKIIINQIFFYLVWYFFVAFILFVLAAMKKLPDGYGCRAFALGCHPSKTTEIARNLSNRERLIAKDDFLYRAFA